MTDTTTKPKEGTLFDALAGIAAEPAAAMQLLFDAVMAQALADPLGALECTAYIAITATAVVALAAHLRKGEFVCPLAFAKAWGYSVLTALKMWA